jgi:O-antigen/teichoic acid export membrane protein
MGRFWRNLGWLLGSRGVNAVFSLVYLALATRKLGLADFGRFSLIVVMAQAIAGFAGFYSWQAVVRWGRLDGEAPRAVGFALALDLISIPVGGALAVITVWTAPSWLPLPAELRSTALGLCLAALVATRSTPTGLLRLNDRYDLATFAEAILPAMRAAGAIAAALACPTIAGFVAAWAAAELGCAAAYWTLAHRVQPISRRHVSLTDLPARHDRVWRFVVATNLSRTLAVSSKQLLVLLVGALGGAAMAGGFRAASQLGQALVQLGEAVSRAIYPELVRAQQSAAVLARKMSRITLAAGTCSVLLAALAGGAVLQIIAGPEFAFAHGALLILSVTGAVELIGASWDALLVAQGRPGLPLLLRAAPLAAGFLLLPSAIAAYGLAGAATCALLASVCAVGAMTYAARSLPQTR